MKHLPAKTTPGPVEFTTVSYQAFKEDPMLTLFKLFHKQQEKGHFLSHSMKSAPSWYKTQVII